MSKTNYLIVFILICIILYFSSINSMKVNEKEGFQIRSYYNSNKRKLRLYVQPVFDKIKSMFSSIFTYF